MTIFRLTKDLIFPPPHLADEDGLLAVGGDLSCDRLLLAYSMGIFPWYLESSPIFWWSPDPRLVLFPDELHVSRSLRQIIKKQIFTITTDKAFEEVILNCAKIERKGSKGTWLTEEMVEAYIKLHQLNYAHSFESWYGGELVGGLYGVAIGGAFFGESMFTKMSNASKVAFVKTVEALKRWGFIIIDCQVVTKHLISLGARLIPREEFLKILKKALEKKVERWGEGF
ncbi:MAG: leucyl/phenylalanyl-tRNA--protein transferase [Thermodesulfovibrionales bacterium]|nr:leucyl/phenylalanyl-tRNA--protein transferase [Thermodesulfovibrionales bacterium]